MFPDTNIQNNVFSYIFDLISENLDGHHTKWSIPGQLSLDHLKHDIIFFPLLASEEGVVNQAVEKNVYWQPPSVGFIDFLCGLVRL